MELSYVDWEVAAFAWQETAEILSNIESSDKLYVWDANIACYRQVRRYITGRSFLYERFQPLGENQMTDGNY